MITLYKYLFYGYSYYIIKYDNLWNVGETYYVGGGILSGWMITITFLLITELIRFIFPPLSIEFWHPYIGLVALATGIGICIYLGSGRRCDRIYKEIANMEKKKKRIYKILNIIHLLVVNVGFFVSAEYARHLNGYSSFFD